jgi:hypothetical protein
MLIGTAKGPHLCGLHVLLETLYARPIKCSGAGPSWDPVNPGGPFTAFLPYLQSYDACICMCISAVIDVLVESILNDIKTGRRVNYRSTRRVNCVNCVTRNLQQATTNAINASCHMHVTCREE